MRAALQFSPRPAGGYPEAVARFEELRRQDDLEAIRPEGRSILLTHGEPVAKAVVLLHGLTNCPEQFRKFGELLHSHGVNVVIPRCRHAGLANRLNVEQGKLRVTDLIEQAETGADIARGLGCEVMIAGLSASAVAAAWLAQRRDDFHKVVVMNPFFGIAKITPWLGYAVGELLEWLPNFFQWWNPALREKNPGADYAYPRYPTRIIADTLHLSRILLKESRELPLKTRHLVVVTSVCDKAVNNGLTGRIVKNWKEKNPDTTIVLHRFSRHDHVPHDLIDPHHPGHRTALVYPILSKLILAD